MASTTQEGHYKEVITVNSHHVFDKKLTSRWDSEREPFTTTSYTYNEIQKRRQEQTVKQSL